MNDIKIIQVLPLTFTETGKIMYAEIWHEENKKYYTAIGVHHCPPIHAIKVGYTEVFIAER